MTLLRRKAKPVFLSIPKYVHELLQIRTASAFRDWVYFKCPFPFPLAPFPLYVTVELTTLCNFRCKHCWRLSSLEKRGIGSMAVRTFEKIVREIKAAKKPPSALKIGGAGEPALHPHFREVMSLLDMLKGSTVKSAVYTNGTLFERFSAHDITRWNINRIVVSVDGIDPESYEAIRVGGNYRQLRDLVSAFVDFRDHLSRQDPWIEIRHVIMEHETLKQLLRFRTNWVPPGDMVKFQSLNPVGRQARQPSIRRSRGIRRELPIEWNGNVPIYCGVGGFAGSLESQTMEELWFRIREHIRKGVALKAEHETTSL